ncbi:hypothetical protein APHAL10511_001225 [Amanita phalloides]|nr:hypothetical protein APHAL10511_001225 [Amanita phalloides]
MAHLLDPASPVYKKARRFAARLKSPPNDAWTPFRVAEKRYKARFPPPDLSATLDLATRNPHRSPEITQGLWRGSPDAINCTEICGKQACIIPHIPGLVVLPSFIGADLQRELIRWALCKQVRDNETNLHVHYHLPEQGLWNAHLESRLCSKETIMQPKRCTSDDQPKSGPRQLVDNTAAAPETFDRIIATPKPPQSPSTTLGPASASALLYKLRWANIGWSYHWGIKQYDFTKPRAHVDSIIKDLCRDVVEFVDWDQVFHGSESKWGIAGPEWKIWNETYEPDAGIVNFYQTRDTLMGHVDRSEVCATSPLVSISLGNAAVFLIGGKTREIEPIPLILRSGDVIIMSGPDCRRAYHGVPRVLEGTLPPHLRSENVGDSDWPIYEEYMNTTRININFHCTFSHAYLVSKTMENDQGVLVDLYVPRKCAATNRLITSKDHASVQISIADVDANGRALPTSTTFALCGQVRSQGEGDDSLNRLATTAGLLRNVWSYQK